MANGDTASAEKDLAMQPAPVIASPGAEYAPETRVFQGIPGVERAPKGRLWATWYGGGPTEGPWNYVMLVTSADDGETWSDLKLVIDPPGDVRTFDPCLWVDPEGRMWLFYAQAWDLWDGRGGVWAIVTDEPDAEDPSWSAPRRLCDGVMMNKPVALSTGEWLLPAAVWANPPMIRDETHRFSPEDSSGSNAVCSTDKGATWALRGGCDIPARTCDEHHIVERHDGTLWTLARTLYGIGESFSADGGRTWSPGKPSWIPHVPHARFFIRRLASGKLLLVKHSPPAQDTRSHLTAYLSDDDGATWYGGLLLDERRGVSYPDGVQAPDGAIYLIYDYSRYAAKQILMSVFTQEDVVAGECVSDRARLRVLVNQATGETPLRQFELSDNADGIPLITDEPADIEPVEGELDTLRAEATLFTNRAYTALPLPELLDGASFVRSSIDSDDVVCARAGIMYVITPLAHRNRDSVELQLLRKGFRKASVPEFMLFGQAEGNICSVFQKQVQAKEELKLGKWGIIVTPK